MAWMRILVCLAICGVLVSASELLNKEHCKCRVMPEKKIVGGKQAHSQSYPWMASINLREDRFPKYLRKLVPDSKKDRYHSCGGMILNTRYILTAAHCVPEGIKHMSVGFGNDNDLYKIFDAGRIKVKRYVIHPEYYAGGDEMEGEELVKNDIAILELVSPIQFDDEVQPGCIQAQTMGSYPNGGVLSTAGYGLYEPFEVDLQTGEVISNRKLSRYLKEVELKDVSATTKKCQNDEGLLCANSINPPNRDDPNPNFQSSCKGDSGSAIYAGPVNGKVFAIGLTSYSDDVILKDGRYAKICIGLTYYSRIVNYLSWIESVIGKDYCTV